MSVALQNIEPFSEIEREIRKLESLLTEKAMEAEMLHETLDILRADQMSEPSRRNSAPTLSTPTDGLDGRELLCLDP